MSRKDPVIEAAEDELVECLRMLWRMPDRERGFLYHSTLRWPDMVRDQGDYPGEEDVSGPLSRREVARVEAMFLRAGSHVERAVAVRDLRLVSVVATHKACGGGGFGWDDVWNALGGMLATGKVGTDGKLALRKVTSDAMRVRYERALAKLAGVVMAGAETDA